jgi:hypothetical protein
LFLFVAVSNHQAIAWGFGAALIVTILPVQESSEDIGVVLSGVYNALFNKGAHRTNDPNGVVDANASPPASSLGKEGKEDIAAGASTPRAVADSDSEFEA